MEVSAPPAPPLETPPKRNVVARRIFFGAILLAIACGLLYLDYRTGRSFGIAAMTAYSVVFGLRELHRMLESIAPVLWKPHSYLAGLLVVGAQAAQHELPIAAPVALADAAIVLFVLAFLTEQLRHTPTRERLLSIVLTIFGVVYILVLGSFVLKVRYLPDVGPEAVLYLVLAAKGTDMFAFFTGRFLGSRKLIPWISPGKTVAGAVGGILGAIGITFAFALGTDLGLVFPWRVALPLGIIVGLSAMAGDLVESLIKRSAAVKDSGGLVPEFGGVLDIIDCILFVAPAIYFGALLAR